MTLPGMDPIYIPGHLSPGARRTARRLALIARGIHPFGRKLAGNGQTCGECFFAIHLEHNSWRGWKCELYSTSRSETSDLRVSWPACDRYSATKPDGYESRIPDQHHGGPR